MFHISTTTIQQVGVCLSGEGFFLHWAYVGDPLLLREQHSIFMNNGRTESLYSIVIFRKKLFFLVRVAFECVFLRSYLYARCICVTIAEGKRKRRKAPSGHVRQAGLVTKEGFFGASSPLPLSSRDRTQEKESLTIKTIPACSVPQDKREGKDS